MSSISLGFQLPDTLEYIVPDKSLTKSSTPKIHLAGFGDGYEQRLAKGINNKNEKYSLSFENRPIAEINKIVTYFDEILGVTALDFTIPGESAANPTTIKVVCETYNRTFEYNNFNSLDAEFRRVYEP